MQVSSFAKNSDFFLAASCKKDTVFGAARKIVSPSYLTKVLKYVQGKILNLNFHLIIEMEVEILFMD